MWSRMPNADRARAHERNAISCTPANPYMHVNRHTTTTIRKTNETQKNVLNLGVRWPEIVAVNWFCCFCCSHSLHCVSHFLFVCSFANAIIAPHTNTYNDCCVAVVIGSSSSSSSSIVMKQKFSLLSVLRSSLYKKCVWWLQRDRVYLWILEPFNCYRWLPCTHGLLETLWKTEEYDFEEWRRKSDRK